MQSTTSIAPASPNDTSSIIVMGVSASGKSTFAWQLAKQLQAKFIDGDDLHPRANIDKMASGQPLNDDDRAPWLTRINDAVYSLHSKQERGVIACSALKKQYRDAIRVNNANVTVIYLHASKEVLLARLTQRQGHFMKAKMIESQLATLEAPHDEPNTLIIDAEQPVDIMVAQICQQLTPQN
ncbi:gluconokinase [Shewanella maritima]|uniref:gluconokinase n=1 Tax=Shewanella maritima TaxID=2520507 RepID=UPI0037368890